MPPEEQETPDPLKAILDKIEESRQQTLADIDAKLDARLTPKEEPPVAPVPPVDPNYGFDPQRMVGAAVEESTKGSMAIMQAIQKAGTQLRKEFKDDLTEEEIESVISHLGNVKYSEIPTAVANGGHLVLARSLVGDKYKQGKYKVAEGGSVDTPVGGGDTDPTPSEMEKKFNELYGAFGETPKNQLNRLRAESRNGFSETRR